VQFARGRKASGNFQITRQDLFHEHSYEYNHEPKMKIWSSQSWCQSPINTFFICLFLNGWHWLQ